MKWMPPYWNNKALPTTTLTDTFILNFLIISFILIKKKCYSDVIWKGRKKVLTQVDGIKRSMTHALPPAPLELRPLIVLCNVDELNHSLVGGVSVHRHRSLNWHFFFDDEPARFIIKGALDFSRWPVRPGLHQTYNTHEHRCKHIEDAQKGW